MEAGEDVNIYMQLYETLEPPVGGGERGGEGRGRGGEGGGGRGGEGGGEGKGGGGWGRCQYLYAVV